MIYRFIKWVGGVAILVATSWALAPSPPPSSPWLTDVTRVRQELLGRIAELERRVQVLEAQCGTTSTGEIKVYYVDTVAGKIECRGCRFVKDENGGEVK
jgi:hypothetical protein